MSENTFIRKKKGRRELWQMFVFVILILTLVSLLYIYEPFSDRWNDLLSNFFTIFSAAFSATCATLVFLRYESSDSPRPVWMYFSIGLWLWVFAELVWAVYNLIFVEVRINIADVFWVGAYGFYAYAVYLQYQIVFHPSKRENILWTSLWVVFVFSLTALTARLLVTYVNEDSGLPLWVSAFYPAADIAVGLVALRIFFKFRGGALGYPWLVLFIFGFADMLYAVVDMGGFYTWSINEGNLWSMVADVAYIAAYLFVGLGCFVQLLLLRYGPIFKIIKKDVSKTI